METRTIARWRIEFDPEATRNCYSQLSIGVGCPCFGCRNFDAAAGRTFPPAFLTLAEELGIDPRKPIQLDQWRRLMPGLWLNGGWFHFVGSLIEGVDALHWSGNVGTLDLEQFVPGLEIGLSRRVDLVVDAFKGPSLVQMYFQTNVPWVLDEEEPEYWNQ